MSCLTKLKVIECLVLQDNSSKYIYSDDCLAWLTRKENNTFLEETKEVVHFVCGGENCVYIYLKLGIDVDDKTFDLVCKEPFWQKWANNHPGIVLSFTKGYHSRDSNLKLISDFIVKFEGNKDTATCSECEQL